MFDRKLFTHYSWTGLSKSKNKLPFGAFFQTHAIFKKLVHVHDTSYTDAQVKVFFQQKNMHHSDRRSDKPIIRASATKVRGGISKNVKMLSDAADLGVEGGKLTSIPSLDDSMDLHPFKANGGKIWMGTAIENQLDMEDIEVTIYKEKQK